MIVGKERLLHLLGEAAELEHNLLCSYLFALFSLKQGTDEDLTPVELQTLDRWRDELMGVCVEEMTHLAQVANLTLAIGNRAHFNRPNIPVAAGYHPASIVVELTPFDLDTLDHFAFLERPAGHPLPDGASFAAAPAFVRIPHHGGLMASGPNYQTIGEFYDVLKELLSDYARQHGETALFSGPQDVQLQPHELHVDSLHVIKNLGDALAAVDSIVKEGEGASAEAESSHFAMFNRMRADYNELLAKRPAFKAGRSVGRNPVMHAPVSGGRTHLVNPDASRVADAANAAYGLMLRFLGRTMETPWSTAELRKRLIEGSVCAMKVVSLLGKAVTRLDAAEAGGPKAGMSFAMQRVTEGPLRDEDALALLVERAREIAQVIPGLPIDPRARDDARRLLSTWLGQENAAGGKDSGASTAIAEGSHVAASHPNAQ
jgi:hypothetical protein